MTKLKEVSLEALGQKFGEGKALIETQTQQELHEIIGDDLTKIPAGNFRSNIPGIASLSILPLDKDQCNIVLFSRAKNRPTTLTLTREGKLIEDMPLIEGVPAGARATKEDLRRELVALFQNVGLEFWRKIDMPIEPAQGEGEQHAHVGGQLEDTEQALIDSKRIQYARELTGALFGVIDRQLGFKGYHGIIFENGKILLEHPQVDNAAYVTDLNRFEIKTEDTINLQEAATKKPLDNDIKQKIITAYLRPLFTQVKTKSDLRRLGKRITHQGKNWCERIAAAVR